MQMDVFLGDVDNIKIDLKSMGWKDVEWIHLVQNIPQYGLLDLVCCGFSSLC